MERSVPDNGEIVNSSHTNLTMQASRSQQQHIATHLPNMEQDMDQWRVNKPEGRKKEKK